MREYLVVGLVAAVVTYLLAAVARQLALRVGAVARVRDRDVHAIPIPYFGGIAMLGGIASAYLVARHLPFLSTSEPTVFADARAVLLGGAVMCLVGAIDDVFELDALTKFAGQVVAAAIVVVKGIQLIYLPLPHSQVYSLDQSQAQLFSVLVILVTVNAVNFVDGLDGLATGVVGIGAVAFFSYAFILTYENHLTRATTAAFLTAALGGVCLGFLPHNFFPARMFMGDSGALLIGLVLACSATSLTGQFPYSQVREGVGGAQASLLPIVLPLVLPFAVLIVPFVDLVLAVVRRTRAGRSPFSPDKQHLHHRMLEIGHSHRRAVLVMYTWAALVAFGVVIVSLASGWRSYAGLGAILVLVLAATFWLPRWRRTPDRA